MGTEYIVTTNGELYHWGIKGMKWGVRRYQNKDGSLTKAGKKRYDKEKAELKEREKNIKGHERTKTKLAKLDAKKAELDAREKALKDDTDDVKKPEIKDDRKSPKDMSDVELQNVVNRLRNEDAYRDLSKKLGYDGPTTELDFRIAEMEKQKRYLELQRDIAKLTPEQTSRGKKFVTKVFDNVIEPALMTAGKDVLTKALKEAGYGAIDKALGKDARKTVKDGAKEAKKAVDDAVKDAKKSADKAGKKQSKKEAKKEAKRQAKAAKAEAKASKVFEGEVVGNGQSRKSSDSSTKTSKTTIDAEWWNDVYDTPTTSMTTVSRNYSSGRTYVSGYLNSPIYSLPYPRDDY